MPIAYLSTDTQLIRPRSPRRVMNPSGGRLIRTAITAVTSGRAAISDAAISGRTFQ